jgi:hypothetical protein
MSPNGSYLFKGKLIFEVFVLSMKQGLGRFLLSLPLGQAVKTGCVYQASATWWFVEQQSAQRAFGDPQQQLRREQQRRFPRGGARQYASLRESARVIWSRVSEEYMAYSGDGSNEVRKSTASVCLVAPAKTRRTQPY